MSLLRVEGVDYAWPGGAQVLHGISFTLEQGESLGILGESGSGKSTLLRLLLGLARPTAGRIEAAGRLLDPGNRAGMRVHRQLVQPVFQDPYASLDPRMRIGHALAEPLAALGLPGDPAAEVARVLAAVGLPADSASRSPHAFSGGQRQRIAIARALIARPRILLADEPVSALDLSTRVRIIDLLAGLRQDLSLVMVSHDIAVVAALCSQMIVLERGRIVEAGPVRHILKAPAHPYTRRLLASLPRLPAPTLPAKGAENDHR
jgi:peptide/nickel transport system ATP-binding protein